MQDSCDIEQLADLHWKLPVTHTHTHTYIYKYKCYNINKYILILLLTYLLTNLLTYTQTHTHTSAQAFSTYVLIEILVKEKNNNSNCTKHTYIKDTVNKHGDQRFIDTIGRQQRTQCPTTNTHIFLHLTTLYKRMVNPHHHHATQR